MVTFTHTTVLLSTVLGEFYLSRGFNECYLNTHRTRQLLRDNIATVQPVTTLHFLFLKAHWVKGWIIPKSAASFFARM